MQKSKDKSNRKFFYGFSRDKRQGRSCNFEEVNTQITWRWVWPPVGPGEPSRRGSKGGG